MFGAYYFGESYLGQSYFFPIAIPAEAVYTWKPQIAGIQRKRTYFTDLYDENSAYDTIDTYDGAVTNTIGISDEAPTVAQYVGKPLVRGILRKRSYFTNLYDESAAYDSLESYDGTGTNTIGISDEAPRIKDIT